MWKGRISSAAFKFYPAINQCCVVQYAKWDGGNVINLTVSINANPPWSVFICVIVRMGGELHSEMAMSKFPNKFEAHNGAKGAKQLVNWNECAPAKVREVWMCGNNPHVCVCVCCDVFLFMCGKQ